MMMITGPIWATTANVSQVSGCAPRKVRRALRLGIADAFKSHGIWVFDVYAALILTVAIALKDCGLRWRKIPVALERAHYTFPKNTSDSERRKVHAATSGTERLRRFLELVNGDAFVIVKHTFATGMGRVVISSASNLPHLRSSRLRCITVISLKMLCNRLLTAGNGSFAQSLSEPMKGSSSRRTQFMRPITD